MRKQPGNLLVCRWLKRLLKLVGGASLIGFGLTGFSFWSARRPRLEMQPIPILRPQAKKADRPDPVASVESENLDAPADPAELAYLNPLFANSLPASLPFEEGKILRILHISDLHLWAAQRWLVRFCRNLADEKPDLVVLTGDNFADQSGFDALKEALEPLLGFPGLYVWGSNDFYSGQFRLPIHYFLPNRPRRRLFPDLPTAEFGQWLSAHGWIDLNNRSTSLKVKGWKIAASGVEDPHINRDLPLQFPDSWEQADLRLGISHAPYARVLNAYTAAQADLVLAGHTHGGQICLPGSRALTNNTDLPLEYSQGLFDWKLTGDANGPLPMQPAAPHGIEQPLPDLEALNDRFSHLDCLSTQPTWVNISPGLGTSKFTPIRLFCPPKAHLLHLLNCQL